MRVLKFGGTSVATAEKLRRVSAIVASAVKEDRTVVVVSALAGVTDRLKELVESARHGAEDWKSTLENLRVRHQQELALIGVEDGAEVSRSIDSRVNETARLLVGVGMVGECSRATRDRILATGERLSVLLVTAALGTRGLSAEVVDGTEMIEARRCGDGHEVLVDATAWRARRRLAIMAEHTVPVVTGFVAVDPSGRMLTLGRGGSDLSATVLAAALDCTGVEIWTDVNGVMSGPPRVVQQARTLPILTEGEAAQLAFFGAKVLHPTCLAQLAGRDIPVLIRNTLEPAGEFTTVRRGREEGMGVRAVAGVEDVAVFEVKCPLWADAQWASRLEHALEGVRGQLLVALRSSADESSIVVVPGHLGDWVADRLAAETLIRRRGALLALVGSSILAYPGAIGRVFEALGRRGVSIHGVFSGSTAGTLSLLVEPDTLDIALEAAHEALEVSRLLEVENETETQSGYPGINGQRRTEARSPATSTPMVRN